MKRRKLLSLAGGLPIASASASAQAPVPAVTHLRDPSRRLRCLRPGNLRGGRPSPAFAGIAGHEPDTARARVQAAAVSASIAELATLVPGAPAYSLEASYFQKDWPQAFWGPNYARLRTVKAKYDPDGLFFIHHGVGSEAWSADGFTRLG